MSKFQVGQRVVVVNSPGYPEHLFEVCTVTSELAEASPDYNVDPPDWVGELVHRVDIPHDAPDRCVCFRPRDLEPLSDDSREPLREEELGPIVRMLLGRKAVA